MVIVVHGGAGRLRDGDEERAILGVRAARDAGWAVLAEGGSALAAVIAAVRVLEDDPFFNAGTGSALNRDGFVEMDAAVMNGEDLSFGAVGAVRDVQNPVLLAEEVRQSEHIFLVGEGASRFARERGIPRHPPEALITERALLRWQEVRRKKLRTSGTVGAVALDAEGGLAAATSTGGIVDKRVGRVGDSPLIGAGTYAEAGLGAASATGEGEFLARALVAYRAVSALSEQEPQTAGEAALSLAQRLGGEGGLILVDARGRIGIVRTAPTMSFAYRGPEGEEAGVR